MLASLPHPREIILCDLFRKMEGLCKIQQELVETFGFQAGFGFSSRPAAFPTNCTKPPRSSAPRMCPMCSKSIGPPGHDFVDDSTPHIFSPLAAVERFEASADVLFTEGGVLKMPTPIKQSSYVPPGIDRFLSPAVIETMLWFDPMQLTGCVLSGLLSAQSDAIRPTIGMIETDDLEANFVKMTELGLEGRGPALRWFCRRAGAYSEFS